jgi:UDP-glucose 4-epimerase
MKNILVTGGAGFIGTNLITELIKEYPASSIYSLDCYSSGTIENHIAGVNYIEGYTWNIFEFFNPNEFDLIYHFGEFSRIVYSFENIQFVSESILRGTPTVLEFARRGGSKIIYSASSSKFGNSGENENLSPYSFMKAKMVELIKNYGKWFDLDYEIAYFYNVYGPKQIYEGPYATVIAIFERQYLKNEPLTVVKPGSQTRDFTHVKDIINGLMKIRLKKTCSEYHLRSGKKYEIIQIAKMFSNNIKYIPERKGERFNAEDSFDNTEERLEWRPENSIIEWIKIIKENKLGVG